MAKGLWFLPPHLPIKNWTPKPSQKMFNEMYNYELTLKLWTRMSDNANTILLNLSVLTHDRREQASSYTKFNRSNGYREH